MTVSDYLDRLTDTAISQDVAIVFGGYIAVESIENVVSGSGFRASSTPRTTSRGRRRRRGNCPDQGPDEAARPARHRSWAASSARPSGTARTVVDGDRRPVRRPALQPGAEPGAEPHQATTPETIETVRLRGWPLEEFCGLNL